MKKSSDKIVRLRGEGVELDKRTYVPFRVESKCPNCGRIVKIDLTDDYLSYPVTGEVSTLGFGHCDDECQHEWEVDVILDVTLVLA